MLISFLIGFSIWALSPVVSGHIEPWDGQLGYYVLSLAVSGFGIGFYLPKTTLAGYFAIVMGQYLYMSIVIESGPLSGLGIFFIAIFSCLFLASGLLASFGLYYFSECNDD